MAHKTLIDGTAYEISGGKTLINGTAYKIKNGKTLVGGTAYEVGFAPPVTLTIGIAGYPNPTEYSYIIVNGKKYSNTYSYETGIYTIVLPVYIGSTIKCVALGYDECEECEESYGGEIFKNNQNVYATGNPRTYNYTVIGDTTILLYSEYNKCDCGQNEMIAGKIEIREN